jgi:hypothetical protein
MSSHSKSNGEKSKAGKELQDQLVHSFNELIDQNIILNFVTNKNFKHEGFSYEKSYLINFLIETLDNKFILINSSNSFRNDRFKQQAYDIQGVMNNSEISSEVIASIMLYPDSEISNSTFLKFREKVKKGEAYSPASHLLTINEFYEFLENHKASVESEIEEAEEFKESAKNLKDGSYYGKSGNALEKEVVNILNNKDLLGLYQSDACEDKIFKNVMDELCSQDLQKENIISISATNTVEKLAKGGNAKTDVIININTLDDDIVRTLSIKKSTKSVVSCHDYKYEDFVRVLDIKGTKLAEYLKLFQAYPTYSGFKNNLPEGYTIKEFEEELKPHVHTLTQWALTGQHDHENLIDPLKQISHHLLIVKDREVYCSNFAHYIDQLFDQVTLKYGVPFSWTYPSKNRGKRIQLKMPILI